jgi:hypothetical protein
MTHRRHVASLTVPAVLLTLVALWSHPGPAAAQEKVSLRLDFIVNGYHGPFFTAQGKGYYKEEESATPEWKRSFQYISGLDHWIVKMLTRNFGSEGNAKERQRIYVDRADADTAELYRKNILPDENFHVHLGRLTPERHCTTPEIQARVRDAFMRLQELQYESARVLNRLCA